MERSRNDLETIINSQKDQLLRYEKRLKDIVTAYKGLLKEKEALENSLAAVLSKKDESYLNTSSNDVIDSKEKNAPVALNSQLDESLESDDTFSLQEQITTLMNSLATLSAEKSRMEASFQADKKVLRLQLQQKEQSINELQQAFRKKEELAKADVDEYKAKLIIERQEHEKEINNQVLMIRELQKLYADERHLKESIEMQLNNFKMQFASNEAENTRIEELKIQLKDAKVQIKLLNGQKPEIDATSSASQQNSSVLLKQLQKEMRQLKEHHAVAIKNEQHRVKLAEEQSRKLEVLHENRVANLESRLAELSTSVGSYDRLRQQDQESIQLLKMRIHDLEKMTSEHSVKSQPDKQFQEPSEDYRVKRKIFTNDDVASIAENIMHLKKTLLQANALSTNPIDLSKVFSIGADHSQCEEEILRVSHQFEASRLEILECEKKIKQQKDHITTLQKKVEDLNRNIDEQDLDLKNYNEKLRLVVKEERKKWQTLHVDSENDYRCKLNDLEQQLQKQRQRSLQLLDEKEQEIKALQTSFEIFHINNQPNKSSVTSNATKNDACNATSSDGEIFDNATAHGHLSSKKLNIKARKLSASDNCHMLHYANEIARKDIEIASLRKAKYQAETSMRKAIHEKVTTQEELNNKVGLLEVQVDRLERCKSREGANLEYLKNVIISYIVSKDIDDKRHMINAISAVLQFTPQETKLINEAFSKK